jgi:hypothetical protein
VLKKHQSSRRYRLPDIVRLVRDRDHRASAGKRQPWINGSWLAFLTTQIAGHRSWNLNASIDELEDHSNEIQIFIQ